MKKMTKFFALALLAGAMVSCSTEDTAPSTQNDKVAVQFTGGISVNTRAAGVAWADGDKIGIFRLCKLNCVMLYSHSISSVGERPAPRGGTTRPDERKITII